MHHRKRIRDGRKDRMKENDQIERWGNRFFSGGVRSGVREQRGRLRRQANILSGGVGREKELLFRSEAMGVFFS